MFHAEAGCAAGNWRTPVHVDCAAAREQNNGNGCIQCREITESKVEHTWDTSEGDLYRDSNDNALDGYIGASHEMHTDENAWSYEDYADIAVEYTVSKLAGRIPFSTELRAGSQVVKTMQKDLSDHTDTTDSIETEFEWSDILSIRDINYWTLVEAVIAPGDTMEFNVNSTVDDWLLDQYSLETSVNVTATAPSGDPCDALSMSAEELEENGLRVYDRDDIEENPTGYGFSQNTLDNIEGNYIIKSSNVEIETEQVNNN
ncbi:hypothetical protein [Natrialba asiatica]|nr:hypothetical protein [Natrialba asiatica]